MEINIKMMTEEAYITLQKNIGEVFKQINNHPSDSTWLKDFLGFEPYEVKKYTIEDFELHYSENYHEVALLNVKILYEHMQKLPKYILCNTRFWAWINFEKAYKQALSSSEITESFIKSSWLPNTNRRNLMLGVISRYYFMADYSVVYKNNELDYSLTKYALNNLDIYRLISYANFCMVKNVSIGLLHAMSDYSDNHGQLTRLQTRNVFKSTTRLSSIQLVDVMTEKEIYDYCYEKIEKIVGSTEVNIDFSI